MTGLYCGLVPSIPTTTLVRLPAQRGFPAVHRFAWDASLPAESPYVSERFLSHELIAAEIADAIKPLAPALTAMRGDLPYDAEWRDVAITQLGAVLRFHMYLRGWPVVIVPSFWARRLGRIAKLVLALYDADDAACGGAGAACNGAGAACGGAGAACNGAGAACNGAGAACNGAGAACAAGVCIQRRQTEAAIVLAHTARCLLLPDGYPSLFREAVEEFKVGLRLPGAER